MSEQHYVIIPKEGDHISTKQDEDGAIRALYHDDETNRLDGPVRLLAVDSDDDDEEARESSSTPDALGALALIGLGAALALGIKALIDAIKRKKASKIKSSEIVSNDPEIASDDLETTSSERDQINELASLLEEIGKSDSVTDRQGVFKAVCYAVNLANELRELSVSATLPDEQRVQLRAFFEKMVTPEVITSVNQVLLEAQKNPVNTEAWPPIFVEAIKQPEFTPVSQETMVESLRIE